MTHDPWRVVEPIHPVEAPKREEHAKINIGEDIDEDLATPATWRFSSKNGSIKIEHARVVSGDTALILLVSCLLELSPFLHTTFKKNNIHFFLGAHESIVESTILSTSRKAEKSAAIYFHKTEYDVGMLELLRILVKADRIYHSILTKWGICPTLK